MHGDCCFVVKEKGDLGPGGLGEEEEENKNNQVSVSPLNQIHLHPHRANGLILISSEVSS